MSSSDRPLVVHCHIFKNAGSTFDWSLKRNFGAAMVEHVTSNRKALTGDILARMVAEVPALRGVSSHNVRLPLGVIPGHELLLAVFLRHPIERAFSVYNFELRQPEDTRGSRQAKKLSFRDYVAWRLTPESPAVIRDFQTRFCAGILGRGRFPVTGAHLAAAVRTLEQGPLIGLVDDYDSSMVLFEHALGLRSINVDLSYLHQNVGRYQGTGKLDFVKRLLAGAEAPEPYQKRITGTDVTQTRAAWVLEQLGPELGRKLEDANRNDIHLYQKAGMLMRNKMDAIDDMGKRLQEFRARCGALQKGRQNP